MDDFRLIPTTRNVWIAIWAKHKNELVLFSSFSNPNGTFHGGAGKRGEMWSTYGISGCDYPLIEIRTTWEIHQDRPHERMYEQEEYYLCLALKSDN